MILLNYKDRLFRYFIYISVVFITLFVITTIINLKPNKIDNEVITSNIVFNNETTQINVEYPRYKNDKLNKIITDNIYNYVKVFKENKENKILNITYEIYNFDNYSNIVFYIDNSISKEKNKNILLDLSKKEIAYISNIYDKEYLNQEINTKIYHKYSTSIYSKIKESNVDNHTYIISKDKLDIYFNDIVFDNIDYIPNMTINLSSDVSSEESVYDESKKYIAFTYDDGPSNYTLEVLNTLDANNSSATFFMLGNKMKKNNEIVKTVNSSLSEVASHTYSHKNLVNLSEKEINNEINSTSIIFNEITGDNIKYVRPPYGNYNNKVKNAGYPLVLWNIDPKDWLVRDSNKIYNNIIKNACDGCIVLMHDCYKETVEASKMVIPKLKEMGYEIVSISKLIEIKKYNIDQNKAITSIR